MAYCMERCGWSAIIVLNGYLVESSGLITRPKKPITHIIGLSTMLLKKNVSLNVVLPSTNMFMVLVDPNNDVISKRLWAYIKSKKLE